MKAISLWQPWATAIALGSKEYETRSWAYPASLNGECVAIHAAKRWTRDDQEWLEGERYWHAALGVEMCDRIREACPLGAVVALATLDGWLPTDLMNPEALQAPRFAALNALGSWCEAQMGNFQPGRWAWKLRDVISLQKPVPCKGAQGFFELPADVEASVRAQIYAEEVLA